METKESIKFWASLANYDPLLLDEIKDHMLSQPGMLELGALTPKGLAAILQRVEAHDMDLATVLYQSLIDDGAITEKFARKMRGGDDWEDTEWEPGPLSPVRNLPKGVKTYPVPVLPIKLGERRMPVLDWKNPSPEEKREAARSAIEAKVKVREQERRLLADEVENEIRDRLAAQDDEE